MDGLPAVIAFWTSLITAGRTQWPSQGHYVHDQFYNNRKTLPLRVPLAALTLVGARGHSVLVRSACGSAVRGTLHGPMVALVAVGKAARIWP
jgi:hypothetical protein